MQLPHTNIDYLYIYPKTPTIHVSIDAWTEVHEFEINNNRVSINTCILKSLVKKHPLRLMSNCEHDK